MFKSMRGTEQHTRAIDGSGKRCKRVVRGGSRDMGTNPVLHARHAMCDSRCVQSYPGNSTVAATHLFCVFPGDIGVMCTLGDASSTRGTAAANAEMSVWLPCPLSVLGPPAGLPAMAPRKCPPKCPAVCGEAAPTPTPPAPGLRIGSKGEQGTCMPLRNASSSLLSTRSRWPPAHRSAGGAPEPCRTCMECIDCPSAAPSRLEQPLWL